MKDGHRIAALRQAARTEAATLIRKVTTRAIAEPLKHQMERIAVELGWSTSRVEDIWRGEAAHIYSWEMDILRGNTTKE